MREDIIEDEGFESVKSTRKALLRHHESRIKLKREKTLRVGMTKWNEYSLQEKQRAIGKSAHSPTACSCWMCGNPRRYAKEITCQERRQIDNFKENKL